MSPPCMISACCCCYNAIDCDNIALLCKGKDEMCCFVRECNLDFNEESLGVGMTTNADNKECCKISLAICSLGLKTPDKCCASASRFLCCKSAASFPYDDQYMSKCACACYGLQCAPECGCCGPAGTECPALDRPIKDYATAPVAQKIEQ